MFIYPSVPLLFSIIIMGFFGPGHITTYKDNSLQFNILNIHVYNEVFYYHVLDTWLLKFTPEACKGSPKSKSKKE